MQPPPGVTLRGGNGLGVGDSLPSRQMSKEIKYDRIFSLVPEISVTTTPKEVKAQLNFKMVVYDVPTRYKAYEND